MCGRQSALQLETADARHLNIRNDAARFAEFRRLQKLFSGRKTPGSESECPNEVCRRDANGFIVIDNRNERYFCHCWVILEHWWCLHKTGDLDDVRAAAKQSTGLSGFAIGASHAAQHPRTVDQRLWDRSAFARLGHAVAQIHSSQTASPTLLSATAQPITQARKPDECWYGAYHQPKPPCRSVREIECQPKS